MANELDLHGMFEHNGTFDYEDYQYKEECIRTRSIVAVFAAILFSVALLLGLTGNILVLIVLCQKRRRWSVSDAFVFHLSIADIMLLLTMPLWAVDAVKGWIFGTGLCKINGVLFKINSYCSIFLLVCVTVYFSGGHKVQMYLRARPWPVHLICLAVWLFCLVLSIPDWMYLKAASESEQEDYTECVYQYPTHASHLASCLLYHVLGFWLPVIVLLYCSPRCLLQCKSHQLVQKQRVVQIILTLVLVYFLSWTPYNIALLVDSFSTNKSSGLCQIHVWTAVKSTAVLGFFHSCLNPLIYFITSEKFREWVLTVFRGGSCAVNSGDIFLWESRGNNKNTATQEDKGSLHQMSDIEHTITRQQIDEIL